MERTYDLTEAQARYQDDLKRLRGRRGLLLDLLLDGEWHRNHECAEVGGLSFNDSIFAFRNEGWIIESRHVRGGVWEFRLVGMSQKPTGHKPMTRPQKVVAGHYMYVITELLGGEAALAVWDAVPEWMQVPPKAISESEATPDESPRNSAEEGSRMDDGTPRPVATVGQ